MYNELIERLRNPYIILHGTNIEEMMKSAADAIQYLLAENERLQNCRHECQIVCLLDKYNDKCAELERMRRERDAAIENWQGFCAKCSWRGKQYLTDGKMDARCDTCRKNGKCNWEWRGPQEAEKDGEGNG